MRPPVLLLAAIAALAGVAVWLAVAPSAESLLPESPLPEVAARRQLGALGYAQWGPAASLLDFAKANVVEREPEGTAPGLNLYNSRPRAHALLVDMDGDVVHEWRDPRTLEERGGEEGWHHVAMTPSGELLAITKGHSVAKLGRDSDLLWEARVAAHHDLALDADGRVHAITSKLTSVEDSGAEIPVTLDFVAVLSRDGDLLREISLHGSLRDTWQPGEIAARYRELRAEHGEGVNVDLYHVNSIRILDRDLPGVGRTGDYLLSLRDRDLVVVADTERGALSWSWGAGEIESQHHATLLPNGHVLLFDNGDRRQWSRVLEVDPISREIVWSWYGGERGDLFSDTRGSAEGLSNGNVLVTESNRGRVLEVTRDGRIVWEFYNPDRKVLGLLRAPVYRMTRHDLSSWPPAGSGRAEH